MKMTYNVKIAKKKEKDLIIKTEFIKLESALKLANITTTGGIAKMIIQNGEVKVNGEVCLARGKKLRVGDYFEFERIMWNIKVTSKNSSRSNLR